MEICQWLVDIYCMLIMAALINMCLYQYKINDMEYDIDCCNIIDGICTDL